MATTPHLSYRVRTPGHLGAELAALPPTVRGRVALQLMQAGAGRLGPGWTGADVAEMTRQLRAIGHGLQQVARQGWLAELGQEAAPDLAALRAVLDELADLGILRGGAR